MIFKTIFNKDFNGHENYNYRKDCVKEYLIYNNQELIAKFIISKEDDLELELDILEIKLIGKCILLDILDTIIERMNYEFENVKYYIFNHNICIEHLENCFFHECDENCVGSRGNQNYLLETMKWYLTKIYNGFITEKKYITLSKNLKKSNIKFKHHAEIKITLESTDCYSLDDDIHINLDQVNRYPLRNNLIIAKRKMNIIKTERTFKDQEISKTILQPIVKRKLNLITNKIQEIYLQFDRPIRYVSYTGVNDIFFTLKINNINYIKKFHFDFRLNKINNTVNKSEYIYIRNPFKVNIINGLFIDSSYLNDEPVFYRNKYNNVYNIFNKIANDFTTTSQKHVSTSESIVKISNQVLVKIKLIQFCWRNYIKRKSNLKKDAGIIYVIQVREFINSNESIYKVGKTTHTIQKRLSQYPKGSKVLHHFKVNNCHLSEKELLKHLRYKMINRKDIGSEYFEGDIDLIKDEMIKLK